MKQPNALGYILFNFSKVAIASCGSITLITTYTRPEPFDTGIIIINTIIGVFCIIHGIVNAGSLTRYKKTL